MHTILLKGKNTHFLSNLIHKIINTIMYTEFSLILLEMCSAKVSVVLLSIFTLRNIETLILILVSKDFVTELLSSIILSVSQKYNMHNKILIKDRTCKYITRLVESIIQFLSPFLHFCIRAS